jgi:hypothetical protein
MEQIRQMEQIETKRLAIPRRSPLKPPLSIL